MAERRANATVTYAVIGLLIGALSGYLTRPEAVEIRVGPVQIEVTGKGIDGGGSLTSSQWQHVLLVGLIGGLVGAGFGYLVDRGRFRV